MSVVSSIADNYSVFHKVLIFLMRLAWKSRIRLPYLIMIGFMALDIRLTLEIVIDVEQPHPDNGYHQLSSSSDSEDSDDIQEVGNLLNFAPWQNPVLPRSKMAYEQGARTNGIFQHNLKPDESVK